MRHNPVYDEDDDDREKLLGTVVKYFTCYMLILMIIATDKRGYPDNIFLISL